MTLSDRLPQHPLDEAIALKHLADSGAPAAEDPSGAFGTFEGHTHPDYGNMVGPFGGITAAQVLQAVLQHPQRLGDPVSLTVNFAAGLHEGSFRVEAHPIRTNRSTQHWSMTLWQAGADGQDAVMLTATAVTAVRRKTWSSVETPMPQAVPASEIPPVPLTDMVRWVNRYDMRLVTGNLPTRWDGAESDSLTQLWLRDNPPRPLDYAGLTGLADAFFPRIWLRRAVMAPIGTVSMTVYYHAGPEELSTAGEDHLFGQARTQSFFNGYFDQSAQLWSRSGHLLVTTHQIVYYKE